MKSQIKTKLIGSGVFAAVVLSATGLTYQAANAQFVSQDSNLNVTGIVSVVDTTGNNITITTVDSSPITIHVTGQTKFDPNSITSLSGISVGDNVLVNADRNGAKYTADKISELGGPNYGNNKNRVFVEEGIITDKNVSDSNFTVRFGTTYVNFEVHITTKFNGTTWNKLKVGQRVQVTGENTGTYFLADKVVAE